MNVIIYPLVGCIEIGMGNSDDESDGDSEIEGDVRALEDLVEDVSEDVGVITETALLAPFEVAFGFFSDFGLLVIVTAVGVVWVLVWTITVAFAKWILSTMDSFMDIFIGFGKDHSVLHRLLSAKQPSHPSPRTQKQPVLTLLPMHGRHCSLPCFMLSNGWHASFLLSAKPLGHAITAFAPNSQVSTFKSSLWTKVGGKQTLGDPCTKWKQHVKEKHCDIFVMFSVPLIFFF